MKIGILRIDTACNDFVFQVSKYTLLRLWHNNFQNKCNCMQNVLIYSWLESSAGKNCNNSCNFLIYSSQVGCKILHKLCIWECHFGTFSVKWFDTCKLYKNLEIFLIMICCYLVKWIQYTNFFFINCMYIWE